MKYTITEKQLSTLISKQNISDDLEYENVSNAEPESDDYILGQEVDEQESAPTPDTSSGEVGKSMGASEYPPYPEVGKWESGVTRGPANQIATNSKWSDVVGSKITRGHANPLKENTMENKEQIKESLLKMKGLMVYDSGKTRIENNELIKEGWNDFATKVGDATFKGLNKIGQVAKDTYNYNKGIASKVGNTVSSGLSKVGQVAKDTYNYDKNLLGLGNNEKSAPTQGEIYTDFDKDWDYKILDNMWWASRKGQNKWVSLKNLPVAIKKLNDRYKTNVAMAENTPEPMTHPTNMTQGFVNEDVSLSNKEQWRKNKKDRLNKKLGRF